MTYLDKSSAAVLKAFEVAGIDDALDALLGGLWAVTGTQDELVDLLDETADRLSADGLQAETAFCRELHMSVDTRRDPLTEEWFAAECLRITGWGKPSPTRVAARYLERRDEAAEVRRLVADAVHEVRLEARAERLARCRRRAVREERVAMAGRFALKAVLAVGTGGVSLAFPELLDDM